MTRIEKAMEMVQEIQTLRPGWRFSLLGGDITFDYTRTKAGKIKGVDKNKLRKFGWTAEFFGSANSMTCYGQRHASASYLDMLDAILVACSQAKLAIKNGAPE